MSDQVPTSSPTPPTVPGVIGRGGLPTSRAAVTALACGVVGLLLFPAAVAAIIFGIVGLRRVHKAPGRLQGNGLAIGGIALGLVGLIVVCFYLFMGWMMLTARREMLLVQPMIEQQSIHAWMRGEAALNGRYPPHVASMALDDPSFPMHSRISGPLDTVYVPVLVGAYDLTNYDGSPAQRDALTAAIGGLDGAAPYYRVGDFSYVRLAQPTDRADIVFSWYDDPGQDVVLVTMDDGTPQRVPPADWALLWETDAAARGELSLEPLGPLPPLAPR